MSYEFKTTCYKHQFETWDRTKDKEYHGLLLSMGLGKGKVLLDTAGYLFESGKINALAILVPKGTMLVHPLEQVPAHLPDRIKRRNLYWKSGAGKAWMADLEKLLRPQDGVLDIFTMNIEALISAPGYAFIEKFLRAHRALLAVDESTSIGSPAAARTRKTLRLAKFAPYRRILTGNCAPNSPLTVFSQCQFLSPDVLGTSSYVSFKNEFTNQIEMRMGPRSFKAIDARNPYKNLDRLTQKISKFCTIIAKEDALDLPPKVYQTRYIEMSSEQKKHYDTMRQLAIVDLEGKLTGQRTAEKQGGVPTDEQISFEDLINGQVVQPEVPNEPVVIDKSKVSTATLVIVQLLRLHQLVCGFIKTDDGEENPLEGSNHRLEALLDLLEETSGSVIIWATFRHNIRQIAEAISKKFGEHTVATYFGDTSNDDRQTAKEDFQSGRIRFLVINQSTGKYGLTLTKANTAIYYSNSFDRESRIQSEDRCHRIGTSGASVNYIDLVTKGTVDEKIIDALKSKKQISDLINASNWREFLGGQ